MGKLGGLGRGGGKNLLPHTLSFNVPFLIPRWVRAEYLPDDDDEDEAALLLAPAPAPPPAAAAGGGGGGGGGKGGLPSGTTTANSTAATSSSAAALSSSSSSSAAFYALPLPLLPASERGQVAKAAPSDVSGALAAAAEAVASAPDSR